MITLVAALLALIFFGLNLIHLIRGDDCKTEDLGWGYLLGLGIFTNVMFLANWLFKIPFETYSLWLELLALICFTSWGVWWRHHRTPLDILRQLNNSFHQNFLIFRKFSKAEKILSLISIITILLAINISLFMPVKDWDSIVLYDFRAIVFSHTGNMDEAIERGYFFGYPLLTSLGHTWIYLNNFKFPGIIHSLLYAAFILIAVKFLSTRVSRLWTAIGAFSLATLPVLYIHALMTYTNLAYSVYFCASILMLIEWAESKKQSSLVLAGLTMGLSTWSRSAEPFWLLTLPIVLLISIINKKWLSLVWYLIPIFLLRQPWLYLQDSYFKQHPILISNPDANVLSPEIIFNPARLWGVVSYFYLYIVHPFRYELLLFLLVTIQTGLIIKKLKKETLVLPFIILGTLMTTLAGIFIFSVHYEDWQNIGGSSTRMVIFLPPLIQIFTILILQQVAKRKT